jgi:CrcB protein
LPTGERLLAVAVGAAVGAALRWLALRLGSPAGEDVVLLGINVAGAAALGALTGWPSALDRPRLSALVGPGICGGLTTWSGLALPAAQRLRDGHWAAGVGWPALTVIVGVAAASATHHLAGRASPVADEDEELDW